MSLLRRFERSTSRVLGRQRVGGGAIPSNPTTDRPRGLSEKSLVSRMSVVATQSISNVKSPVVRWVSTETARQATLYLPGFSSGSETVSKAAFD
jgi:hypothetical protein